MEYLELWVTWDGFKRINRKVGARTNIEPPTSQNILQQFIDVVNYYWDMWPSRSHTLAPLTRITSNKKKVYID